MRYLAVLLGLLLVGTSAGAQGLDRSVEVYGFFAPGFRPSDGVGTYSIGGGADWLVGDWLAVGADAHAFGWWECFDCGAFVLTGNVGFLRRRSSRLDRWEPFAKVGAGVAPVEGGALGIAAISAGTNYWFKDRFGLRFEGRYDIVFDEEGYLHFRVGVVF